MRHSFNNKKLVSLAAALLAACLLLCGCTAGGSGNDPLVIPSTAPTSEPAATAPAIVQPSTEDVPAAVYADIADKITLPEMMAVPEGILFDYYGIDTSCYTKAVFVLAVDSLVADEIVVVECVDEASAGVVETLLNTRLNSKLVQADGYSPEQYARISKCQVLRNGLFVSLIVTDSFDTAAGIFDGYTK